MRPTNSVFVIAISIYVLLHHRKYFVPYLLIAAPIGLAWCYYHYSIYHRIFSPYYSLSLGPLHTRTDIEDFGIGLLGTLFSPSRGLFVYTPVVLLSLWGMYLALKTRWATPLSTYLILVCLANWMIVGKIFVAWAGGGWSYGPRLATDIVPVLIFFLIPVFHRWCVLSPTKIALTAVAFTVTLAISVFIHGRGAFSSETHRWNYEPPDPPLQKRLWDWKDPQFLRGLSGVSSDAQTAPRLVENGGFETDSGLHPWMPFQGSKPSISADRARSGRFSLLDGGGDGSVYEDVLGVQKGTSYCFSAWVSSIAGSNAVASLGVYDPASNVATFSKRFAFVESGWQFMTHEFKATSGTVRIHLIRERGEGPIYWDDVNIAPRTCPLN